MSSREGATLVYDGDCGFCSRCAEAAARLAPEAEVVPWQLADLAELGLSEERAAEAVQWVGADGTTRAGHEALAALLLASGRPGRLAGRVLLLPGVSWLAARAYGFLARNRHRLPGGTPACAPRAGGPAGPPGGGDTDSDDR